MSEMVESAMGHVNSTLEFFDKLYGNTAQRIRDDLEVLAQRHERFTERLIHQIFADSNLIRALKVHRRSLPEGAADVDCEESAQPVHQGGWQTRGFEQMIPANYVWNEQAYRDLEKRVKEHLNHLQSYRNKTYFTLSDEDRYKVDEYVRQSRQWLQRVDARTDLIDFESRSVQLVDKLQALVNQKQTMAAEMTQHETTTSAPLRTVVYDLKNLGNLRKQQASFQQKVAAMQKINQSMQETFDKIVETCNFFKNMYGKVKTTGRVVEFMETKNRPTVQEVLSMETKCEQCQTPVLFDAMTSSSSCPKCGTNVQELNCTLQSYSEDKPMPRIKTKSYSHKSYAKTWLRKVQAQLSIDIPEAVYFCVFTECVKRTISVVKQSTVRAILKQNGFSSYYSAIPAITSKFNGVPPPKFTEHEERILDEMFSAYESVYVNLPQRIRRGRKSYLSYSYVYRQCCKIKKWDQYVRCFPLLEGYKNLHDHDRIWKAVCEKTGWPFNKTI